MKPYLSLLLLSLIVSSTPAFAQFGGHQGTPQQQRACRHDVLRHCRGIQGDYAISSCLQANMSRLSGPCRRVFGGR
jgi:hypothetical protein